MWEAFCVLHSAFCNLQSAVCRSARMRTATCSITEDPHSLRLSCCKNVSILHSVNLQPPNVNMEASIAHQHAAGRLPASRVCVVWGAGRKQNQRLLAKRALSCMRMHQCLARPISSNRGPSLRSSAQLGGFCTLCTLIHSLPLNQFETLEQGALALPRCSLDFARCTVDSQGPTRTARPCVLFCLQCYCLLNGPHKMVWESASATRIRPCLP